MPPTARDVCKILTLNSTMFGRAIGWCVVKKEKVLVHPESLPVPQKNWEVLLLVLDWEVDNGHVGIVERFVGCSSAGLVTNSILFGWLFIINRGGHTELVNKLTFFRSNPEGCQKRLFLQAHYQGVLVSLKFGKQGMRWGAPWATLVQYALNSYVVLYVVKLGLHQANKWLAWDESIHH